MDIFRVLIADDNADMRDILRRMISRAEGYELVCEAESGQQAIEMVEAHRPHVVFLDVEMPGATGVECARIIQDMDPTVIVIFATAHAEYMGEAFEVYAFDYLIKPFKLERVMKTLEKAHTRLSGRAPGETASLPADKQMKKQAVEGKLMLHHRGGVSILNMADILLVQREDRATVLYTIGEGRYVTADTLGEMEERLANASFFRCHKSYIINLNHIRDITPYGRWTYIVRLNDTKHDALMTHEKYEELERLFA